MSSINMQNKTIENKDVQLYFDLTLVHRSIYVLIYNNV